MIYLKWFRDQYRGQEAADTVGAEQTNDGSWPIALWHCDTNEQARTRFDELYKKYGINATTHYDK